MSSSITIIEGADLPDVAITWSDRLGAVIDLSTSTFTVKVGSEAGGAATITKTAGVTGSATAPNVVIAWTTAEVGTLTEGRYVIEVVATTAGKDRVKQISLLVTRKLV